MYADLRRGPVRRGWRLSGARSLCGARPHTHTHTHTWHARQKYRVSKRGIEVISVYKQFFGRRGKERREREEAGGKVEGVREGQKGERERQAAKLKE